LIISGTIKGDILIWAFNGETWEIAHEECNAHENYDVTCLKRSKSGLLVTTSRGCSIKVWSIHKDEIGIVKFYNTGISFVDTGAIWSCDLIEDEDNQTKILSGGLSK
jgi:WD40 repeat protein